MGIRLASYSRTIRAQFLSNTHRSPWEGGGHRRRGWVWTLSAIAALVVLGLAGRSPQAKADDYAIHADPVGDAVVRRTDIGASGVVDSFAHRLPDLRRLIIGSWKPSNPSQNLYVGQWDESSNNRFLRVDLEFDGLVNPPGSLPLEWGYNPFEFGPNPVFGFIELDVDRSADTGGDLAFPEVRYLSNGGRFGGIPDARNELRDRFAIDRDDIDGDCTSGRAIEYSGEEFHIALLRSQYTGHRVVAGDDDDQFESGETWDLDGTWLHRAHGYERFSLCGSEPYQPPCTLRWSHAVATDVTTVTLVFPLTNRAARDMRGESNTEPYDCDPLNQASVQEVLEDLTFSGEYWLSHPRDCKQIITGWYDVDASQYLRPRQWEVNALLATSYAQEAGSGYGFVWTDIYPDATLGNVNGDSLTNHDDYIDFYDYVRARDGSENDADGVANGQVVLFAFADAFSVFDLNYDGIVDADDAALLEKPGDMDGDQDADLDDWRAFSVCWSGPQGGVAPECVSADVDFDGDIDLRDAQLLLNEYSP